MREAMILAALAARAAVGAEYHLPGDFADLHAALEALYPGDVLVLGDGTYGVDNGTVDLRAGASGAVITLRAAEGAEPVVRAASGDNALRLKADWWTVEGIRFDGRDSGRDVVSVRASHVVLRDCTVTNGNLDGVDVGAVSDVELDGCVIYDMNAGGSDAHGVVVGDATDVRILGCEIFNCSGDCIQLYADGAPLADLVLIDGCHLWTGWSSSENAVDVKASTNVTISRNLCHGFTGDTLCAAIVVHQAVTGAVIEKNLVHDCAGGIRINVSGGGKPQSVEIRHNVVRDTVYIGGTSGYGIQLDEVVDVRVYNNTLAFLPGSSFWLAGTLQDVLIKNNLIVSCDVPHYDSPVYAGATTLDYQGWFDAVPVDVDGANSIAYPNASDARFLDAGARDLGLASDSPAREAGVDVGLPYSGSAPDLGAYDFDYSVEWPSGGGTDGCGSSGECGSCALPVFLWAILWRRRTCANRLNPA